MSYDDDEPDELARGRMNKAEREDIARRLRAARALAGVTVAELAERLEARAEGLGTGTLGKIERSERDAMPYELDAIADACELSRRFFTVDLRTLTDPSLASSIDEAVEGIIAALTNLRHTLK